MDRRGIIGTEEGGYLAKFPAALNGMSAAKDVFIEYCPIG
jgi:hypothetical protein